MRYLRWAAEPNRRGLISGRFPKAKRACGGLGSPERDAYVNQLRGAGPTELAAAARLALATGDRALAAAVMQLNGNVPKRERLFSAGELAEAVVGDEVRTARERLAQVRGAVQRAFNENRAFERGQRLNPTTRIADGLRARGEGR